MVRQTGHTALLEIKMLISFPYKVRECSSKVQNNISGDNEMAFHIRCGSG